MNNEKRPMPEVLDGLRAIDVVDVLLSQIDTQEARSTRQRLRREFSSVFEASTVLEQPNVRPGGIGTIEVEERRTQEPAPSDGGTEPPQDFGRCPVCGKPLRPRCKHTGIPRCPPVNAGFESRAKCDGCGTIIVYVGNSEWRVLLDSDVTDDDREADKMDRLMGF